MEEGSTYGAMWCGMGAGSWVCVEHRVYGAVAWGGVGVWCKKDSRVVEVSGEIMGLCAGQQSYGSVGWDAGVL